jgi:hypothetical protein
MKKLEKPQNQNITKSLVIRNPKKYEKITSSRHLKINHILKIWFVDKNEPKSTQKASR